MNTHVQNRLYILQFELYKHLSFTQHLLTEAPKTIWVTCNFLLEMTKTFAVV